MNVNYFYLDIQYLDMKNYIFELKLCSLRVNEMRYPFLPICEILKILFKMLIRPHYVGGVA
mgnify:CR=1 FL=1